MELKNTEITNLRYIHKQLTLPNSEYSNKLNEAISRELIARFGTMSKALINRHIKNIYDIENFDILQNNPILSQNKLQNILNNGDNNFEFENSNDEILEENEEEEEENELNNEEDIDIVNNDNVDDSDCEKEIFPWRINFLNELTLNHWTSKRKQILLSREKYLAMLEKVRQYENNNNEEYSILSTLYPPPSSFSSSSHSPSCSSSISSTPSSTNIYKKPYLKYKIIKIGEEKIIEMLAERKNSERLFLYNEQIFDVLYKIHMDTRHGRSMSMYSMIKNKFANITIEQIKLFLNSCEGCKNWNKNEKKLLTLLANNPNKEKVF
uniref:Integrase_H2C2 domain-containing protein n=1 Tax=Meloidogyne hapla TaxID=6305 RepID=A0A1I8BHP1_MELHA